MSLSFAAAVTAVALVSADDVQSPRTVVDGHTISVEKASSNSMQRGPDAKAAKNVSLTFAVEPKDAKKSFAYEIGQRFVARDAEGKEIPIGRVHATGREPVFRLVGYPAPPKANSRFSFRESLTVALPVMKADVTSLASLEGDLFVSDVELLEFTYKREELTPNTVKKIGAAEAKLFLYDEHERGVDIGFKLRLPVRSRAEALTGGGGGFGLQQFLLYTTDAGRKSMLTVNGRSGGGGVPDDDPRVQTDWEFQVSGLDRRPEALHLVIPVTEYPRRLQFQLKNVAVPADARPPSVRGRVALNRS